jgi:hypothetical protein
LGEEKLYTPTAPQGVSGNRSLKKEQQATGKWQLAKKTKINSGCRANWKQFWAAWTWFGAYSPAILWDDCG